MIFFFKLLLGMKFGVWVGEGLWHFCTHSSMIVGCPVSFSLSGNTHSPAAEINWTVLCRFSEHPYKFCRGVFPPGNVVHFIRWSRKQSWALSVNPLESKCLPAQFNANNYLHIEMFPSGTSLLILLLSVFILRLCSFPVGHSGFRISAYLVMYDGNLKLWMCICTC